MKGNGITKIKRYLPYGLYQIYFTYNNRKYTIYTYTSYETDYLPKLG